MATSLTGGHILIFSFGPVQSFIAQARRTQDLWVGSRILFMIGADALQAALVAGAAPIFPAVDRDNRPLAMPNRFIVHVADDPETIANIAHRAAIKSWTSLSARVMRGFAAFVGAPIDDWQTLWRQQCGDEPKSPDEKEKADVPASPWLEVYWASAPQKGAQYRAAYTEAAKLLAGRKMLRQFGGAVNPLPPQPGEKCTLNGVLSALSNDSLARRDEVRAFWDEVFIEANRRAKATVRRGERLCALSAVKRFAETFAADVQDQPYPTIFEAGRFPSTSTIAAAPFTRDVAKEWDSKLEATFKTYRETLDKHAGAKPITEMGYPFLQTIAAGQGSEARRFALMDGDFLREEGLTDAALADYAGLPANQVNANHARFEQVRAAYRAFIQAIPETVSHSPASYYAVIKMDGDRIGKFLSSIDDPERHRAFSAALADFASQEARQIVEEPFDDIVPGRLIYSGGDDVLAMTPALSALTIADRLQAKFAEIATQAAGGAEALHASAGIAFAHYTHPLESVLNAARRAEEEAKRGLGRNALAVSLMRRSGETRNASIKWMYGDIDSVADINRLRQWFMPGAGLSSSLAYETYELARVLDQPNPNLDRDYRTVMRECRKKEFLRLVKRHTTKTTELDNTEKFGASLADLAEQMSDTLATEGSRNSSGWLVLANWLMVARFLARSE